MARDKVYLVIVKWGQKPKNFFETSLDEMRELTSSAGGIVVGHSFATLSHPSPSHFIRHGKVTELTEQAAKLKADVIIFNSDLSPGQARNIETETGVCVVDRTGLILDIFARRAKSKEGKLQVELAQLNYLLPRLSGQGVMMSRPGGGIGTRGPGEQKLEVDRRRIRQRIQHIRQDLDGLEKHRALLREGRRQKGLIQVSIVGYTNAGKTTLLNALTNAEGYAADQLFATLDPKTRIETLNGNQKILFTDTVGFIRDLPHTLIKAFHATLEEVAEADILIHVLDVSSPDCENQKKAVEAVLREIKADEKRILLVLNKADLLDKARNAEIAIMFPEGILISAQQRLGLHELMGGIEYKINLIK